MRRNPIKLTPKLTTLLLSGLIIALSMQTEHPAQAHGATIVVSQQAVEIVATFDTGEPMSNAQVSVYAPNAPDTPWQTGQTDSDGRFLFSPESGSESDDVSGSETGLWEVTVRKAGHGQTTAFALDHAAGLSSLASSASAPTVQKWFSMAAIIWGCIGTALYFSRRDRPVKRDRSTNIHSTSNRSTAAVVASMDANNGSDR